MIKDKIKAYLDYIPFIIVCISASILVRTVATTNFVLTWRNIIGLVVVPLNILFFNRNHWFGVLFLGLMLFLGLFGLLSYTPGLARTTMTLGFNNSRVEFWGQPIFLLWIVIHFILSRRYYVGILSKRYWLNLRERK